LSSLIYLVFLLCCLIGRNKDAYILCYPDHYTMRSKTVLCIVQIVHIVYSGYPYASVIICCYFRFLIAHGRHSEILLQVTIWPVYRHRHLMLLQPTEFHIQLDLFPTELWRHIIFLRRRPAAILIWYG